MHAGVAPQSVHNAACCNRRACKLAAPAHRSEKEPCVQAWVNIAVMSERLLGQMVWVRGLSDGWSIKDAFDRARSAFESLGASWPKPQVRLSSPRAAICGWGAPPYHAS